MPPTPGPLGRRRPPDWAHVEKYPARRTLGAAVDVVNRTLALPSYRVQYDQGAEGACVGYACSWMTSILNRRRYAPRWLWDRAKERDPWPDTNPGDNEGTTVRAALDVLRDVGHCRAYGTRHYPTDPADGIAANRWATTVDEVRTAIAGGTPVVLGVNWYTDFDAPVRGPGPGVAYYIGRRVNWSLGGIRGGHAVCAYGASDARQAVRIVNNWGYAYPLVWMPYTALQRLLEEDGEAALVTDR